MSRVTLGIILLLLQLCVLGQNATIKGVIKTEEGFTIEDVNIIVVGTNIGTTCDKSGRYSLEVPVTKNITLKFSHSSFWMQKHEFQPKAEDLIVFNVQLKSRMLDEVKVEGKEKGITLDRFDAINPSQISNPGENIENTLQFGNYGVSQNNELSAGYNVRGGNFNENLIYVNGIEVYRPFLARSGQQEGLSFINPYMVESVLFSAGGFDAKYGDKLSSVLDITYGEASFTDPSWTNVTTSLLGAAVATKQYITPVFNVSLGGRYRTNSYLLGALDTKGEYKPTFSDFQGLFSYHLSEKWKLSFFGTYSVNSFRVVPENRETNFGSINEALRFTVYYEGQEITKFRTNLAAFSLENEPNDSLKLQFVTSIFRTVESEHFDLLGEYKLDELERDLGKDEYGEVAFNRGVGAFLHHARNDLDALVANAYHRGSLKWNKHKLDWGSKAQLESIHDKINEWNYLDSARFNIPHPPDSVNYVDPLAQPYQELHLSSVIKATNNVTSYRFTGYIQDRWSHSKPKTIYFSDSVIERDTSYLLLDTIETYDYFNITAGVRSHFWSFNEQNVISPRVSFNFQPARFFVHNREVYRRNLTLRFATGFYYQPPFYRAARNLEGFVNPEIRAQKSIHFVLGGEYNFFKWDRIFRFGSEIYYKHLSDIIPYEIDNVRIRYLGNNNAKGYAYGIDLKLNGQFIKGIESYASLSYLKTEEDILDDYYYDYFNVSGEKIIKGYTLDQVATDSIRYTPGYIPRPTDQRVSFAMFFQDKMPEEWNTATVKWSTLKVNLTMVFGTRLPYGPPNSERYMDTLRSSLYKRVDIGFTKEFLTDKTKFRDESLWLKVDKMWLTLEVFNLLDISNTINYSWIKDVSGRQYSIPSYLTSRRINLKLVVQF